MAENMRNAEPGTSTDQTTDHYHYEPESFLSHAEIRNKKNKIGETKRIYFYLENVERHHFEHMQVRIPVYNVKHVTTKRALDGISDEEGFGIMNEAVRENLYNLERSPDFQDLLYWSADITSDDLENARQQAYEKVRKVIVPSHNRMFSGELREQFGNSPAFKESVSRYGNFKFSFPLYHLLSWYKDQHCRGGEPQMKILGTELYKKEIAHYIVVHSPDTDNFDGFPEVPTVQGNSDPLPFVYWRDGTLYWRPESTSDTLKVIVTEDGNVRKECFGPCPYFIRDGNCFHIDNGIYSVWNYLVLAFHLPNGHLEIPKELLIKNLTACAADEKNYLKRNPLHIKEAEKIVQDLREEVENRTCSK